MNELAGDRSTARFRPSEEKWKASWDKWVKEADARLAFQLKLSDERMDQQFKRMDERLAAETKLHDARAAHTENMIAEMKADLATSVADTKAELAEVRRENRSTRILVVTTAIGSVIAIAAFNATVLSNMIASFESGKDTALSISMATERIDRLEEKMAVLTTRVDAIGAQITKLSTRIEWLLETLPNREPSDKAGKRH
jgi:hypothetical protein